MVKLYCIHEPNPEHRTPQLLAKSVGFTVNEDAGDIYVG